MADHAGRPLDSIALARLRREIDSLKNACVPEYWAATAALSGIMFEPDATKTAAKNALRLGGNNANIVVNCALALARAGLLRESLETMSNAAETMRGDPDIWERVLEISRETGQLSLYLRAAAHLATLGRPVESPDLMLKVANVLRANNFSEEQLMELLCSVKAFFAAEKARDESCTYFVIKPQKGVGGRVSISYKFIKSTKQILELERKLFDHLALVSLPIETSDVVTLSLGHVAAGKADDDPAKAAA